MSGPEERVERLARRLDRVLLAIAAIAAAIAVQQGLRYAQGATDLGGLALALGGVALVIGVRWLPAPARILMLVVAVSVLAVALAADVVIAVLDWGARSEADPRSLAQVVRDLRAEGLPAVPASRARAYLEQPLRVGGRPVVPLAGLPDALEVLCDETGTWRWYPTDRMGLTNPDPVWDAPADVLLVGDSFAQGFCVPEAESFAGRIRARHPATVNLAGGANGPLVELGTVVEFGARARPRLVLWFFYEGNDFDDALIEFAQPLLRTYLEPGGSQRLLERLPAVQAAQWARVEGRLAATPPAEPPPSVLGELARVPRLGHLRHRLGWVRRAPHSYETLDREAAAALVSEVMRRMQEEADALGARLVLVYLPARDAVAGVGLHPLRPVVLDGAREAGIEVVDVAEVLRGDPRAVELFATRRQSSHFTPEGNRVVAEQVLDAIEGGGWLAPP